MLKYNDMKYSRKQFLRFVSTAGSIGAVQMLFASCGGGSSGSAATSVPVSAPFASGNWSDPLTWGGAIPNASSAVTISAGQTVYLDTDAVCASLQISGTLQAVRTRNISLTTGYINVGATGIFEIGTEGTGNAFPSNYTATITLNGAEAGRTARFVQGTTLGFTNDGVGRSLQVQPGGKLSFIGQAPAVKRSRLNSNVASGVSSFTLADITGWKAGDEIVVGTTDFFGSVGSSCDRLILASAATGTSITTTGGVSSARWGVLQFVTDAGISLTNGTLTGAPTGAPTVVDERAFVVHLTRNIVVQGVDDTAWTSRRFGAHCMFMGRDSNIKLDGVQFRRVGQAGAIGRYPIHWHMMSYNMPNGMNAVSDGTFLGAVVGSHYVKNCSVSESSQRMVVIHGTHGVTVDSNVGFDITGHAIFLEDGSEQDNVVTNNAVLQIRAPTSANKLLLHDAAAATSQLGVNSTIGTAGIWFTNPKNTLSGNWVNDSEGAGIWNSFTNQCFGLSAKVALNPRTTPHTLWDDNWAVGCKGVGVQTNDEVRDDKGTLSQYGYEADFRLNPIKRVRSFKNSGGGYNNRIRNGKYQEFILADNAGMDVFGQSEFSGSTGVQFLTVAETLNNASSKRLSSYRAAFATYHELLNFEDSIAVGYTYIAGAQGDGTQTYTGGGLFRLWDLYTQPLFSFSLNIGIKLINCDAPFRTLPPHKDGATMNNRNWSLAGALYDKTGVFGQQGKYWVYDDPFFTYSATSPINVTTGTPSNGKVTTDHYFGVEGFRHAGDLSLFSVMTPLTVVREDASGNYVGDWTIPDGNKSTMLGNMRHFAAHQGGRYKVSFPTHTAGNYCEFTVTNQKSAGDMFLIAVPFGAAYTPVVYQGALGVGRYTDNRANLSLTGTAVANGQARYLTSDTLVNVLADTTGAIYFRDTANNLIWMQVKLFSIINKASSDGIYGSEPLTVEYKKAVVIVTV